MHSLRANQKLAVRIVVPLEMTFLKKKMSAMLKDLLKNHQYKQNLDIFYEFSNGGLFIILFYSVLHHLFCIKTCYSVNNDYQPKVGDSLALCAGVRRQNEPLGMILHFHG